VLSTFFFNLLPFSDAEAETTNNTFLDIFMVLCVFHICTRPNATIFNKERKERKTTTVEPTTSHITVPFPNNAAVSNTI